MSFKLYMYIYAVETTKEPPKIKSKYCLTQSKQLERVTNMGRPTCGKSDGHGNSDTWKE